MMALLQGDGNVVSASLRSSGVKMNDKTLSAAKGLAMLVKESVASSR